ncbi:hypothetical protein IAD21_02377 [Abditibacteriota bacterium]|nr:hypothetical protein IAD21_02377 [Abditibacteriota bacterium]
MNSFKFGDRVEIGGRTMLAPGFSLVGLTGMVFPTAPNAPAGTVSVAIDWLAFDYTPENGYPDGSLPPVVNVPGDHLILIEENPTGLGVQKPQLKTNPNAPKKPQLGIVHGGESADSKHSDSESPVPRSESDEDEPPRPKLRLV